ncbi:hypothetical protein GCM10007108_12780 [Thermogymnomonas acidicola]|uniref:Uncharacterized protein n=1 Tax=Thermogymnomonas acidicola TaxID=399579 RepID=A0AA37BS65_9ARCH|nr:hypothetical protein [Thermogymnomonas acidicola]GGM76239.1 hypothetical protein GCM10007108_12780 [Thermogymnomonas acidicola]
MVVGLSKRDLSRKRKSLEQKVHELEEKVKKNPLNKQLREELEEARRRLEKVED